MTEMLRKASKFVFVISLIVILFGSFAVFTQSILAGILYLLVGVLCVLFYAGFIFLFLDMADDIEYIKRKLIETDHKYSKDDPKNVADGWVCEECGRVNQSYTGTCACGKSK